MTYFVYANNATTTLASTISSSALTFTVATGTGNLFPNPAVGEEFYVTFQDAATLLIREIVVISARSGDVFTIPPGGRSQQGTTAPSGGWPAGSIVSQLITAGDLTNFVQTSQLPSFGTTTYPLTLNNSGAGAASGSTFNGSAPITLSYNTIGNFSAFKVARGYQYLPTGMLLQWGTLPAQTDSAYHAYTFATSGGIAFPTACFGVYLQPYQTTSNVGITGAKTSTFAIQGLTRTGFNYIMSSNWNIGGNTGVPLYYFSIGY